MHAMPRHAAAAPAHAAAGLPDIDTVLAKPPHQRTAMERAQAAIWLEFGNPNGRIVSMARTMLRKGPGHPAARARYGTIAGYIDDRGLDLDGALGFVDLMLADERERHAKAARVWGRSNLNRVLRDSLHELVLIGRWLQLQERRGRAVDFPAIIESAATPAWRPGFRVTHPWPAAAE